MRTVVKKVFRSLSSSAATNLSNLEQQTRPDVIQQWKRKDINISDSHPFSTTTKPRDINHHFDLRVNCESLSPIYKLSGHEEACFEELQDKECDYYPNNSIRGDNNVLKMDVKINVNEQNVGSNDIIFSLKSIRFVNSIIFDQDFGVFLTTANYIQRLLHVKAVKKDLMPFIAAAMYDLAWEHTVGEALTRSQVGLLLSVTGIPANHIEDFSRMKTLLLGQLSHDLGSINVVDYLQVLLKLDLTKEADSLPDSHGHLVDLACVLATSCELTHFTLACQAISLVNVAARHLSFAGPFGDQFGAVIDKVPMIFVSPVRLHQFSKLDNVLEDNIRECGECIVRFVAKYYSRAPRPESAVATARRRSIATRDAAGPDLRLGPVAEEDEETDCGKGAVRKQQRRSLREVMDKLGKVGLAVSSPTNGRQKQQHKRVKKRLSRHLKRHERTKMESLIGGGDDSVPSSSSDRPWSL